MQFEFLKHFFWIVKANLKALYILSDLSYLSLHLQGKLFPQRESKSDNTV